MAQKTSFKKRKKLCFAGFLLFFAVACTPKKKAPPLNSVCFVDNVFAALDSKKNLPKAAGEKKLSACWQYFGEEKADPRKCSKALGKVHATCPKAASQKTCTTQNPLVKILLYEGWQDCLQVRKFSLNLRY